MTTVAFQNKSPPEEEVRPSDRAPSTGSVHPEVRIPISKGSKYDPVITHLHTSGFQLESLSFYFLHLFHVTVDLVNVNLRKSI